MSREWLAIPADDATVDLVAAVLEAGAADRRRASLVIAEELVAERRAGKDIRSGAVKLAEVMAQASVLDRVASQVRSGDLPPLDPLDEAVERLRSFGGPDPVVVEHYPADGAHGTAAPTGPAGRAVALEDGRTAWVARDIDQVVASVAGGDELPDDLVPDDLDPSSIG